VNQGRVGAAGKLDRASGGSWQAFSYGMVQPKECEASSASCGNVTDGP
jgi:hypothetical protein